MGKGDQKSKRGKIHRGTSGKRRPKKNKKKMTVADVPTKQTAKKTKTATVQKPKAAEEEE
ncbi:MAG: 30S ribosomal protein THX [Cytophagaceae bacterium]|nr:30S ribosomal protein THX [Cytophagaceae bacterium]|tara:strand:+ start:6558 stop:6737 length:180 start_codon:yes stop_codon:yes gene_type:complete